MASGKINISSFLAQTHNDLRQRFENTKLDSEAQVIECFLRQIKKTAQSLKEYDGNNVIREVAEDAYGEIIEQVHTLMKSSGSTVKEVSALLSRKHKWTDNRIVKTEGKANFDDIAEQEIAAIMAVVIGGGGENSKQFFENLSFGNKEGQLDVRAEGLGTILEDIGTKVADRYSQDLKMNGKKIPLNVKVNGGRKGYSTYTGLKSQKIDIALEVTADLPAIFTELARLFSHYTFSIKNYSSYKGKSTVLKLGESSFTKSIYGPLVWLGNSSQAAAEVTAHGANILALPSHDLQKLVNTHFFHLKYVFELTGAGLVDKNFKPYRLVNFIIYNDPNTENVYVRSTSSILMDQIFTNASGAEATSPFQTITIDKAYFRGES